MINSPSIATKSRRNEGNFDRTRLSLVPDIKVIYGLNEKEVVSVEHARKTTTRGRKKYLNDNNKLGILLHDQIRIFYEAFEKEDKRDQISNVYVFGVRTSGDFINYDDY